MQKCHGSATLLHRLGTQKYLPYLQCHAMPRIRGSGSVPKCHGSATMLHTGTVHNNICLACNASQCRVEAEQGRGLQHQGGGQLGTAAGGQQAAQPADQLLRDQCCLDSFRRFFSQIQIKIGQRLFINNIRGFYIYRLANYLHIISRFVAAAVAATIKKFGRGTIMFK